MTGCQTPESKTTPRLSRPWVQELRARRYRLRPELAIHTEEQALRFLDEVGISFLFAAEGLEMPTLWGAINGGQRSLPERLDDYALGLAWEWKDTLPSRRAIYYGKLIRGKPTFISLDLLPCFYTLSENYGDPEDYLDSYRDGRMSEEARRIYEVLLAKGALPTSTLRREAGLSSRHVASRFDRAVAELQRGLRIAKAGISDVNRWKYCYVYDLFSRLFPRQVEEGLRLSGREAMRAIIARYLQTTVVGSEERIVHLFEWDGEETRRVVAAMLADGELAEVEVEGFPGRWLAPKDGASPLDR